MGITSRVKRLYLTWGIWNVHMYWRCSGHKWYNSTNSLRWFLVPYVWPKQVTLCWNETKMFWCLWTPNYYFDMIILPVWMCCVRVCGWLYDVFNGGFAEDHWVYKGASSIATLWTTEISAKSTIYCYTMLKNSTNKTLIKVIHMGGCSHLHDFCLDLRSLDIKIRYEEKKSYPKCE